MKEVSDVVQGEITPKYDYFAKPDGEDIPQKLWYLLKPATLTAFALSTIDVMLYSKPKGYGNILARYAYISFPVLGCTTAFVLTTNLVASARNKQDKVNWVLGGMAAGGIIGVWTRRQPPGWLCAGIFGLGAYVKKTAVDNNYNFFPNTIRPYLSHRSGQYDYTITKNIPGNYTTGSK